MDEDKRVVLLKKLTPKVIDRIKGVVQDEQLTFSSIAETASRAYGKSSLKAEDAMMSVHKPGVLPISSPSDTVHTG